MAAWRVFAGTKSEQVGFGLKRILFFQKIGGLKQFQLMILIISFKKHRSIVINIITLHPI